MWNKIKPYVISIAIALAVGGLSALFTKNNMEMYGNIAKPPLSPPGWVFPVAWGILYVLMGIGAAQIYINRSGKEEDARSALFVYGLQLLVNFFWSMIFFNMQAFLFAFIWLIILWVLVIVMIIMFKRVNKTAAYIQIPYLLWVTFAGYLTLAVYILNR